MVSVLAIVVADDSGDRGVTQIESIEPEFLPEVAPADDFSEGGIAGGAVAGGLGEEVEPDGDLVVADSGFSTFETDFGPGYSYAAVIENPTAAQAEFVTVRVLLRDADGKIGRTDEQIVQTIAPGQTIAVASETPDGVAIAEIEVRTEVETWREPSGTAPTFAVSEPETEVTEFETMKTTAELSSDAEADLTAIDVVAVYRNGAGEIVGGTPSFLDFLPRGETAVATIESATVIPGVESTEVYPRGFAL